jgi:hypothetical protein
MVLTSFAKDIILKFLQDLFAQPDLYDGKNEYVWSPDPQKSKILIADAYTEDLETMEMRPAIVLRRGALRWMFSSLNQRVFVEFRTGQKTFQDVVSSDLTAECLSRNGLEAELLADLVFQSIQSLAHVIRTRGAFAVDSVGIGPETLIQSDSQQELSAVPVNIRLLFQRKWRVTPSAELLERIRLLSENAFTGKPLQETEISKE